jgi:hypothetical protein
MRSLKKKRHSGAIDRPAEPTNSAESSFLSSAANWETKHSLTAWAQWTSDAEPECWWKIFPIWESALSEWMARSPMIAAAQPRLAQSPAARLEWVGDHRVGEYRNI